MKLYSAEESAAESPAAPSDSEAAAFFLGLPRPFFAPPAALFLGDAFFLGEAFFLAPGAALGRPRPRLGAEAESPAAWSRRALDAASAAFLDEAARLVAVEAVPVPFFGLPRPFAGADEAGAASVAFASTLSPIIMILVL